jgi:hypothetical protein
LLSAIALGEKWQGKLRNSDRLPSIQKGAIAFQVAGLQEGGAAPTCCRVTRMWDLVYGGRSRFRNDGKEGKIKTNFNIFRFPAILKRGDCRFLLFRYG